MWDADVSLASMNIDVEDSLGREEEKKDLDGFCWIFCKVEGQESRADPGLARGWTVSSPDGNRTGQT
uniref:Uncharacterized protein n=1 Tax=Knipowitschia caucasica TaxID=637954 RepID=A0AAV2LIE4_KNICA